MLVLELGRSKSNIRESGVNLLNTCIDDISEIEIICYKKIDNDICVKICEMGL